MATENTMLLRDVLAERAAQNAWLMRKHPWVMILTNWVVLGLLVMLLISGFVWGINVRTQRVADEKTAAAMETYRAELKAQEDERARAAAEAEQTAQAINAREATAAARALYGIRLFIEKYGYSDRDLVTYLRCMFNRAESSGQSLEAVIAQDGQFLGYSDENPVLDDFYTLALASVEEWHAEQTKPCDAGYQFAELTPEGIYLKADINADGYARRWRA